MAKSNDLRLLAPGRNETGSGNVCGSVRFHTAVGVVPHGARCPARNTRIFLSGNSSYSNRVGSTATLSSVERFLAEKRVIVTVVNPR